MPDPLDFGPVHRMDTFHRDPIQGGKPFLVVGLGCIHRSQLSRKGLNKIGKKGGTGMSETQWVHPELRWGEVFLCNDSPEDFEHVGWTTKRLGEVAYRKDGTEVGPSSNLYPVFVQASELEETGIDPATVGFNATV